MFMQERSRQKLPEQRVQIAACLGKGIVAGAEDGADLRVEVGVVLGESPDREDQVLGLYAGDAAFVHPAGQHEAFLVHEAFEVAFDGRRHAGGALQDFVGEKAAFAGVVAREIQFSAHVGEDFGHGIPCGIHRSQGVEPGVEETRQEGLVDRFFRGEVVEEVGL
jgi:hypothetical protein